MDAMEMIELREELGSLRLEKERMEIKFGKIVLELKDELDQTVKDKARLQEELIEVEMLESKMELKNQQLLEENEGLRSTVSLVEKASDDLSEELGSLRLEKERMENNFSKHLMEEKNVWEERTDKIKKDNKEIIRTLLDSQDELVARLNRKTAVLDAFSARVSELVKNTRRIIEVGEDENVRCSEGGEDDAGESVGWFRSVGGDDEVDNVIQVETWLLEELKAIEAAAFVRRSEQLAVMDGWGVGNSEDSE